MARKETDLSSTRRTRTRNESTERPAASVNMDELRGLIALLRDNGLAELELENEGFRVRLRRDSSTDTTALQHAGVNTLSTSPAQLEAPVTDKAPASVVHPGAQAETAASVDHDLHIISSPIVGTFYRTPSPTAEPFVKIGSNVEPDTVVCIIEAMKLMNEIQAEATGEVVKIYVENGQPVEYGQPLFGVRS